MTYLLLQTFALLLASYFLGAFLACLVKRTTIGERAVKSAPIGLETAIPAAVTVPPPVRARPAPRPAQQVKPRPIDPVQPKIDFLRRPEPRPAPKFIDPTRFERALMGPDPNEGIPRRAIVEIRPAVLKSPTGPLRPRQVAVAATPPAVAETDKAAAAAPSEKTKPVTVTARPADATTAAAAGAVAAAKAAAAASATSTGAAHERAAVEVQPPAPPPPSTAPPREQKAVATPVQPEPVKSKPAEKSPLVVKVPIEGGDDLQCIRAIDTDLEQRLKAEGIIYFEHIAAWTAGDVKRMGQLLGIPGRIDREQWVEQAQILAKGGETYYSRNRMAAQKTSAPATASGVETPASLLATATASASSVVAPSSSGSAAKVVADAPAATATSPTPPPSVAALVQNRSVAEMAAAAAAAIAAASASVTRGFKPIEPISPLSKVDPRISIPAKLSDAIRERGAATAVAQAAADKAETKVESPPIQSTGDDLKRIRGVGLLIEKRLNAIGITRYEQIANWTSSDIDRVSQTLEFKGRIERESWVEQARILSSGGQTEFSRRFDRGEVDTSRET